MILKDLMLFSKHVQSLPIQTLGSELLKAGITCLDLTVREGGHVSPSLVQEQLPSMVDMLAADGIRVGMITTNITDAHSPIAEEVLRTARACGIRFYKVGYFHYSEFGSLRRHREEVKSTLRDLAQLNAEIGMHGGFHNHSADFLGAGLWDIDYVLDGVDPRSIGVYFDPAHATIEGGSGGWKMGLDLLLEKITMLAVKDFRWVDGRHRYAGGRSQSVEFCPLSQGNTPWPEVLRVLTQRGFDGPISFHSEYQRPHSFADLTTEQVIEQTKADIALFRQWCDPATAAS